MNFELPKIEYIVPYTKFGRIIFDWDLLMKGIFLEASLISIHMQFFNSLAQPIISEYSDG